MKKNSLVFTAVLVGLSAATLVHAQAALPTKIAVIDMSVAMQKTKEGQKAGAEMQAKFGPRQTEYEKRTQEIQQLTDRLNKGQATMSEDEKKRLSKEITDKSTSAKRFGEDSQNDAQMEGQRIAQELGAKLSQIITPYAIQNNFAVVMDISGEANPILWSATAVNITDTIVQLYDQAHPVGAPDAAAPPAKTAPATTKTAAPAGKK